MCSMAEMKKWTRAKTERDSRINAQNDPPGRKQTHPDKVWLSRGGVLGLRGAAIPQQPMQRPAGPSVGAACTE